MRVLAYFRTLAAKFFHRNEIAADMDEELRSHIELRTDDLERSGLSRAEAKRRARIEFGGSVRQLLATRWCWAASSLQCLCWDWWPLGFRRAAPYP